MTDIIDCPICGDTVEADVAAKGEAAIRADERERLRKPLIRAIEYLPIVKAKSKAFVNRDDVIEAIQDCIDEAIKKESISNE